MKALGVILFKSIGAGYGALNMAGRMADLEVLEFAPLGDSSQILVTGEAKKINSYIVELRTGDIHRSICIADFDEKILRAYLSLENSKLENFLLTVEGNFAGDLIMAASELVKLGLSIVDLRVFRTKGSPGYLAVTGKDLEVAQDWMDEHTQSTARQINVTLVTDLSKGFRHFVDLES